MTLFVVSFKSLYITWEARVINDLGNLALHHLSNKRKLNFASRKNFRWACKTWCKFLIYDERTLGIHYVCANELLSFPCWVLLRKLMFGWGAKSCIPRFSFMIYVMVWLDKSSTLAKIFFLYLEGSVRQEANNMWWEVERTV